MVPFFLFINISPIMNPIIEGISHPNPESKNGKILLAKEIIGARNSRLNIFEMALIKSNIAAINTNIVTLKYTVLLSLNSLLNSPSIINDIASGYRSIKTGIE